MAVLTVCAVGVFLASPWVMLYRSNCITRLEAFAGGYNSLFSLIPFTLLVALTGPVGGAVFLIILAILHLSIVFHASEFGSLPNGNTFFLLYETTPAEIRDFVAHFCQIELRRCSKQVWIVQNLLHCKALSLKQLEVFSDIVQRKHLCSSPGLYNL